MNDLQKLINFLNIKISEYRRMIREENEKQNNDFDRNKSILNKMMYDQEFFSTVDIDDLIKDFKSIGEEDLNRIKMYQKFASSKYFPLKNGQKEFINSFIAKILDEIDRMKKSVIDDNMNAKKYKEEIETIEYLINKLTNFDNGLYLNGDDIKILSKLLKENQVDLNESAKIISYVVELSIQSLITKKEEEEEEVIEVSLTNIEENQVADLFGKFGYNFDDFEKNKDLILKYGDVDKIKSILEVLKENNIILDIPSYKNQLAVIFINSDSNIVSRIIKNINEDIKNIDLSKVVENEQIVRVSLNETFKKYLSKPSFFIKEKRRYEKSETEKINEQHISNHSIPNGDNDNNKQNEKIELEEIYGAFNNYIQNRQCLIDIGVNIQSAIDTCFSIFNQSNKKIRRNIEALDFYKFPREKYSTVLTALKSSDSLSSIDQFIELGCYDYLICNPSRLTLAVDDPIFYRIKMARQLGKSNSELYLAYKNKEGKTEYKFKGIITSPKEKGFGINSINGRKTVNQYYPPFNSKYDEVIQKSNNVGPLVLVFNNFFVQKIEQNKIDEYRYDFNGIIISRYKVLRIYETLIKNAMAGTVESIKYAICKNSILTEDEYLSIDRNLNEIFRDIRSVSIR